MKDDKKTKSQLIEEITLLKQEISLSKSRGSERKEGMAQYPADLLDHIRLFVLTLAALPTRLRR